jgi:membrane-associated phospholipid phosphatase
MSRTHIRCVLLAGLTLSLLALIALAINHFLFQFPGNNYFPPNTAVIALLLILACLGCYIQFKKTSAAVKISRELIYFFLVMSVIALATNAVQYTPFMPIDNTIIRLEERLNIRLQDIVLWTIQYDFFTRLLVTIYDTLPYQMSIIPIAVIFMRKFSYLREYYCLLLISALIGFSLYYFYPTLAPATTLNAPFFSSSQFATGIKFKEIHQHIPPTTIEGGMIAFPSFHAIWAWLCLFMLRWSRLFFFLLLPVNVLLIFSCVLLGWHYPLDLLGSLIVLILSHLICANCKKFS